MADGLASRSINLPAFRVQIRHLSIQALTLTVQLNDAVVGEDATEKEYEAGFKLDK